MYNEYVQGLLNRDKSATHYKFNILNTNSFGINSGYITRFIIHNGKERRKIESEN